MSEMTEETALNLLDELMQLNSNIKALIDVMETKATSQPAQSPRKGSPSSTSTTSEKLELPLEPESPPQEPEPYEPPFEPVSSLKKFEDGSQYAFFGDPACNPTGEHGKPPDCYGDEYGSPSCQKKFKECIFNIHCERLYTERKGKSIDSPSQTPPVSFQEHIQSDEPPTSDDDEPIVDPPTEEEYLPEEPLTEAQEQVLKLGQKLKELQPKP